MPVTASFIASWLTSLSYRLSGLGDHIAHRWMNEKPIANRLQSVTVSAITKHFVLWSVSDMGLILGPSLAQIHRNDGPIPTVLCGLEKIP